MKTCKIIRTTTDLLGIISISIFILMYIPKPYSEVLVVLWSLIYSFITIKNFKKKDCNFKELS